MKSELLIKLNPEQKKAVETIQGPILIIAGAGSGKTGVITKKIAYLVSSGIPEENILALTFTDKAAAEMLSRVNELVGPKEGLTITTFHSFCKEIIEDNILELKLNSPLKVIEDTAQLVWFIKNIDSFKFEFIKIGFKPITLVEELRKVISKFKDEFVTIEKLEGYIEKKSSEVLDEEEMERLLTLKDILKAYKFYEDYKTKNNLLDFGDMLTKIYELFKTRPTILKKYQERFKYVLIDEFQDTNFIQLQIINLIAAKYRNITVVGDDDQSIYRFRGAYLTNISEFREIYPDHKEIVLEQNYRSTKRILAVANRLISNKPERFVKKLFTENEEGERVIVSELQNDEEEAHYILNKIQELLKKYDYKDIAILVRKKKDAQPIIDLFDKHKMPYEFIGNSDFFREPLIKDVISFLKIALNPIDSNIEIIRVLQRKQASIKPVEIKRFSRFAYKNKLSLYETFERLTEIEVDLDKFNDIKKKLEKIVSGKNNLKLPELVYRVLFEIDFYKYEVSLNNKRNISLLNQFYTLTVDYYNLYMEGELEDFMDFIEYASNFEIKTETQGENNVIQIMTIHTAKGKEFPVVIVPDLVSGKLPTKYRSDKFEIPKELLNGAASEFSERELHIQEERRLFYVSMTRAEKNLIITYAKRYGDNKRDSKESEFLTEIDYKNNPDVEFISPRQDPISIKEESIKGLIRQNYVQEIVSDLHRMDYSKILPKLMVLEKIKGGEPLSILKDIKEPDYKEILKQIEEGEMIKEKIIEEELTFSASQFNTYDRCPRIYKYSYIYRIPRLPKPYFDLGGTIHDVIESLSKKIMEGEKINIELALKYLDAYWERDGYENETAEMQAREDAVEILETFLKEQENMKTEIVEVEKNFTIKLGDYSITGFIDRIDRDGNDYVIWDYKTSKSTISENDLRKDFQLLVYDMAVRELFGKRPKQVGLWYLRHNKKIVIEPSEEDIENVKKEILEIIENIMKEEFSPTPGKECYNCDYDLLCDEKEKSSQNKLD
ncbi:MAG: DNA-dependent helicase II [Candidatus Methanofastidiosum methylothiophilum]|uniref:DNA 3'-5' helicase n=1 Tax=Candidatus Methanofastidiosum methylothiophilum TaxID=1705564 RepID=A0A150J6Q0_9EURY|nr:MAG: DNA-dependent helicase II [Candidatus Methanofastidiosum methylthiophilus]